MKKIGLALVCIFVLVLVPGCNDTTEHENWYTNDSELINKIPFNPPEKEQVEWITMTGGLGNITTEIMYSGLNDDVIEKVIDMISQYTDIYSIDSKYIETIFPKIRPIGIIISSKNNCCYYLWPFYDIVNHSDGWTVTTLTDRCILQIEAEDKNNFYTVFSEEIADYLMNGWKDDMPEIEEKSGLFHLPK
mgnify:FL=1|jgi:hypothetical protein